MSRRTARILLGLASVLWSACVPASEGGRLVLDGVTLIDGTGAAPRPSTAIVIRGDRIEGVYRSEAFTPAPGDSVVDGRGLWAIPGLWDAHVHLSKAGSEALPILAGMGITSVRDMGGDLAELRGMEAAVEAGEIIGPRIYMAGPMLEAPATLERMRGSDTREPYLRTRIPIPDTARARAVVDSLSELGVDFVKIREYESEDTYRAVVEAARARGLSVAGHAPFSMPPLEAAALGVTSFEHASYPYPLDTVPAERRRLLEAFSRNSVAIVPTLVAWRTNVMDPDSLETLVHDSAGGRDPRRRLLSDRLVWEWTSDLEDMGPRASGYYAGYWGFLESMSEDLAAMHVAGIPLVAGSDLAGIGLFPGFSLHEEMRLLVEWVGLTPMQAIVSATRAPSRLLSAADSLGTVEAGKGADIVLLRADPMTDIRNTRLVQAVVLRGRFLDSERLRELREGLPPTSVGTIGLVRRPDG